MNIDHALTDPSFFIDDDPHPTGNCAGLKEHVGLVREA